MKSPTKYRLRAGLTTTAAITVALVVAACSSSGQPAKGGTTNAGGAHLDKITIADVPTDSGSQGWIAGEEGFFKAQGLDVTLKFVTGVPELSAAVSSGSAQFALTSPISIANGVAAGLDFRVVAPGIGWVPGGAGSLIVKKGSGITSYKDLKGKTVAINARNTLPYYALVKNLDANGVDPNSVQFVVLDFPNIPGAVESGQAAAGFVSPPYDGTALASGQVTSIGDPDAIVNDGKFFATTNWFGRASYIQGHQDIVQRFAKAIIQASKWGNDPKNLDARRALLEKYTKISDTAAKLVRFGQFATTSTQGLQPIIDLMRKYGGLKPSVTVQAITWNKAP